MSIKKPLHTIVVPSTDFTTEAFLDCAGVEPSILFGYELDEMNCLGGISFTKVSALRKRGERFCTPWHIEGAYDTLVRSKTHRGFLSFAPICPSNIKKHGLHIIT